MAVSKAEILDAIAGMTVLDLSELIKEMEEKFGVSAASASVADGLVSDWFRVGSDGRVTGVLTTQGETVPADLVVDQIWSNPPIRIGKAALHELLRTWLPRLGAGGAAFLVVQKNLGSDSLQRWIEADLGMPCVRFASHKGFRVLEVRPRG